jgi:hypothetical protein
MKGVKQMRCKSLDFDQTQLMSEKTKKDTAKPVAAVFGATGYTGRFVTAELLHCETTPIAVARDAEAPGDNRFSRRGSHAPTST